MRYVTKAEAVENLIVTALGDNADDYDIDAIASKVIGYHVDTDAAGNELLNTAGFEQIVSDDEFWAIVETHDTSSTAMEPTTAWLTLQAGCLIHGDNVEVGILDTDDSGDVTAEPLAPVALPVSVSEARDDHDKAMRAAEARLAELGWDTAGEWQAVDTGYTITVCRVSGND